MFLASAAEAISLGAIPNWLQEERALLFILPPAKLLALYGCCDVLLSLHLSEGFGRGMAEALQQGVDGIATAYGGNTDFCSGPWPTPCADGHVWGGAVLGACPQRVQQAGPS